MVQRPPDFWSSYPFGPPQQTRGSNYVDICSPPCPVCGGAMALREGRLNRTLFWGCQKFRTGRAHGDGARDATVEILVRYC